MLKKSVVCLLVLCASFTAVSRAANCAPPAGVSDWNTAAWNGCASGPQSADNLVFGNSGGKVRLNGQSPTINAAAFPGPWSLTDEGPGKGSLTLRSPSSSAFAVIQHGVVDFSHNNSDLTVTGTLVVADTSSSTGSSVKMGSGQMSAGGLTVGLGTLTKASFQMLPGSTLQLTGTAPAITLGANNSFALLGTSAQRVKLQALGGAVTFSGSGVYDLGHIVVMNGVWLSKGGTFTVASCVAQPGAVVPKEWNCMPSPTFTPLPLSAIPMPGATLKEKVSAMAKVLQAQDAPCAALPAGATRLYRLFKEFGNDHFYTTKTSDRDAAVAQGYKYEGSVGYVLPAKTPDTVPLYRLYLVNGTDHFYTTRDADRQRALNEGYKDEGIEGYIYTKETPGCVTPFYRTYNGGLISDHFYTTDPVERYRSLSRDGFISEGIDGYLLVDPEALKAQKNPVMIVGGTYAAEILYWILESRLDKDGYVYRFFELPQGGTIDINVSADKLKEAVDAFLRDTGASKVHLIGHSQGGIVARTYISRHSGQNTVESMISLASPHKGTQFVETDFSKLFGCPSAPPCQQMKIGSPLIAQINNRPANDPIYYTNFITNNDIFVTPLMNGTMDPCERCSNVHIQQSCPNRTLLDHIGLAFDATVYSGVQQALKHQDIALSCNAL